MIWSRIFPEGDLACLVLLSYTMGPFKGASLGGAAGLFRDALSSHPFGVDIVLFGGIGLFSGFLGQRRRFGLPWQKVVLIFMAVLLRDAFFIGSSFHFLSDYQDSVFPSATLTALLGVILLFFFP